jgi:hypothetical protein
VKLRSWFLTLACAVPLLGANPALAQADKKAKEPVSFGTLRSTTPEAARAQTLDWLQGVGKADEATVKQLDALLAQDERPLLDRLADVLALGDAEAAKLLAEARDPAASAPEQVPAVLKDEKRPAFYRANLALAYAKALSNRRVYEESLDALRYVRPEQVVDPASYFFYRAVAEHALLLKNEANQSIVGVVEDVADSPERYKMVAGLMFVDMLNWKEKDLGEIARKMDNIERRLDLARGGPQTQKIQKDVVARLDELIKKLENQCKGCCQCNGGGCPSGGQGNGGGASPTSPMNDSNIATNSGPGKVDDKKLKGLAEQWGKLPEKERAKAMADLTRDMPARYREVIENYFKQIAKNQPNQ